MASEAVKSQPASGGWPTRWDWDRLMLGAVSHEEANRLLLLLLAKYPQLLHDTPLDPPRGTFDEKMEG